MKSKKTNRQLMYAQYPKVVEEYCWRATKHPYQFTAAEKKYLRTVACYQAEGRPLSKEIRSQLEENLCKPSLLQKLLSKIGNVKLMMRAS